VLILVILETSTVLRCVGAEGTLGGTGHFFCSEGMICLTVPFASCHILKKKTSNGLLQLLEINDQVVHEESLQLKFFARA
jgi:hypothetical protein